MIGTGCFVGESVTRIDPLVYQGTRVFDFVKAVRPKWYEMQRSLVLELPKRWKKVSAVSRCGLVRLEDGILSIHEAWGFDGASGGAIDGVGNMLGATAHDALYLLLEQGAKGFSYWMADGLYRDICRAQGAGLVRSWSHWTGLRCFGWAHRLRLKITGKE